jgi:hypothetical protein
MRAGEVFWADDRGLTVLLVFLVVGLLVAAPLVAAGLMSTLVIEIAFASILVSGAASVTARRLPKVGISMLAILAIGTKSVRILFPTPGLRLLDTGVSLVAVLILTALVLSQVFRRGRITLHRVQGAVAAYLLLGLAFSLAYELAVTLSPVAIRFPDEADVGFVLIPRLLYFSFVTLTTVGYGDIVPVHPTVRSLAITEALIGQLYPAILIGRLVSLEIVSRSELRENAPERDFR